MILCTFMFRYIFLFTIFIFFILNYISHQIYSVIIITGSSEIVWIKSGLISTSFIMHSWDSCCVCRGEPSLNRTVFGAFCSVRLSKSIPPAKAIQVSVRRCLIFFFRSFSLPTMETLSLSSAASPCISWTRSTRATSVSSTRSSRLTISSTRSTPALLASSRNTNSVSFLLL